MEASVVVKGPAGDYSNDLVKSCQDHFSRNYPDCVNSENHGTVMCPPIFTFGYVAPTDQASGAIPLADNVRGAIAGDTAELKIFRTLESFGKGTNQPMFVLTGVKIAEFIENVLRQKLPDDHPYVASKRKLQGEIDFLIIHRQIGVILIEVKAAKKFSKSIEDKAQKQLEFGEEIIRAFLHADQQKINIPVHKVIAMPNLDDHDCPDSNFFRLRRPNVQSDNDFALWWKNKFRKQTFNSDEKQEIQNLIEGFVGQKCEVSSKALLKVCTKLDEQKFLEQAKQSYKKLKKATKRDVHHGAEVVIETREHPELAILARQFLFLNPEQLRVWNGPRRQFINGASGSGKTILVQFKALECAQRGEKVIIVVPSPLITPYKEFFAKNDISSEVDILSPPRAWTFFQGIVPGSDEAKHHFFLDELQMIDDEIRDMAVLFDLFLDCVVKRIEGHDYYLWVACDFMQRLGHIISKTGKSFELPLLQNLTSFQNQVGRFLNSHKFWYAPFLTTSVRSTVDIYEFAQRFAEGSSLKLIHKDEKNMMFPRKEISIHLGHHIRGPPVATHIVKYSNLDSITQVVQDEIKEWALSDSLYHIAVLLTTPFPCKEELYHLMAKKGIPVCEINDRQKNAVVLDFGGKAHSYEWPVVVAVFWSNGDVSGIYTMLTRAVSRLVVITREDVSLFDDSFIFL